MKKNSIKSIFIAFAMCCVASFITSCKKQNLVLHQSETAVVTTFSGGGIGSPGTTTSAIYGQIGSANGMGTAAAFYAPAGVAIDAAGNIYVSEAGNYDVRKITPAGLVSTFVGNTTGGFANGTGGSASFSSIQGIAIDAAGNLYIADSGNQVIRKVTPGGVVTTFAGSGTAGSDNGPATSASFKGPAGVTVDAAGNVYVADFGNKMIRKITADGTVTTLAGGGATGYANGAGTSASFTSPARLAVDAAGNVFVADLKMIRKITPAGIVSTLAGNNDNPDGTGQAVDGTGGAASFVVADGISIDAAGNLYVGDGGLIRKINAAGAVVTLAGGGTGNTTDGNGKIASFGIIRGISINAAGNVGYVADYSTSLIRKIEIKNL